MTAPGNLTFAAVRIAASLLALLAVGRHPYSFYLVVRCVVSPVAAYTAFMAHQEGRVGWVWVFGFVAALFNPIFPARLDRSVWQLADAAAALLILSSFIMLKRSTPARRPVDD